MSKQVLDIQQMQHLEELGVDTSSGSAYWYRIVQHKCDGNIRVISDWKLTFSLDIAYCAGHTLESIRTFTLQDILDLLPEEIYTEENELATLEIHFPNDGYWEFSYMGIHKCMEFFLEENIIDAAYEMLCFCIENGYVETKK